MEKKEAPLNITQEELQRFQNAMKNEEFRKLFQEYAQEIADPENRKRYEEEIAQLEAERGMNVKFINPQDGFVVKTSIKCEGGLKAFINICQSDAVSEATCQLSSRKVDAKNVKGQEWSIPYSLNEPREDLDKAGKKCNVYDIIFHTKTYQKGQEDPRFKQLIINTTFDALEKSWNVKLDRQNLKYPKLKFKGAKTSSIIRTSNEKGEKNRDADIEIGDKSLPYPYKEKTSDVKDGMSGKSFDHKNGLAPTNYSTAPKYSIVHRGHLDLQNFTNARDSRSSTRPQELVVNINLPLCETSSGVDLDIFERQVILDCSDPVYHLDISLPYPVNEDEGRAQFDKSKRRLIVTLPVIPASAVVLNGLTESENSKENSLITEIIKDSDELQDSHRDDLINNDDDDDQDNHRDDVINNVDNNAHNDCGNHFDNDNIDDDNCGAGKGSANGLIKSGKTDQERHTSSGVTCPVFKTPPYSFHQNNGSVTFVLHVPFISLDTMSLGFNGNKCCINFPSPSSTSADFLSPGYALHIQFSDECRIDSERSSVDLNETNLVVVLQKEEKCVGMWQWFMIGSNEHSLEKKIFLTEETLQYSLDQLKDHWAQQQLNVSHNIESACEKETVIHLDIKRENSADSSNMGNILATAEELLTSEVNNAADDSKKETQDNFGVTKDDTVLVNYEDLQEVEFIEENDGEAKDLNESHTLSTVPEIEVQSEKADAATGNAEMQRARALKCRKNRRRRRRSTGSHESSSISEDEDGLTRRGKTRGKHARHPRKSRSLSFGSSAESHDDIDLEGHRCVRFNPVPEVREFSNRADKRKWKELRKQQLLNGNTELDSISSLSTEKVCPRKSSLKGRPSDKDILSVSSDDGNTVHGNKDVISDEDIQKDNHDDIDEEIDTNDDDTFVKVDKPQLTNPLIFDLDD